MAIIQHGRLLLLERVNPRNNFQVPQGGVDPGEDAEQAMWRELKEETNISADLARIHGKTRRAISYEIPPEFQRNGKYAGQQQVWFLLEYRGSAKDIHFANMQNPEFCSYRWSGYWSAIHHSVFFKQDAYRAALLELLPAARKLGV